MSKYYAVARGRETGIFLSWPETQKQVNGFNGAIHKSFKVKSEAEAFLKEHSTQSNNEVKSDNENKTKSKDVLEVKPNTEIKVKDVSQVKRTLVRIIRDKQDVTVYTDGSCINEVGGYGVVIITDDKPVEYKGKVPVVKCTNNIAELYAIKVALELCANSANITLRSDSQYSINSLTKWIGKWKVNGWQTSTGKDVENKVLIQSIDSLLNKLKVKFEHVYGHTGDKYNEIADKLANAGRAQL